MTGCVDDQGPDFTLRNWTMEKEKLLETAMLHVIAKQHV